MQFTTPMGRIVSGHPMIFNPVKDDKGVVKLDSAGLPRTEAYFALAIPKAGEQHWNQTAWGAQIWAEALSAWPQGQYQTATFAWKITDGDSTIPNKKMKVPNQREGWANHWVIQLSSSFAFEVGRVDAATNTWIDLASDREIKCGDYATVVVEGKGNNSTQTAGMYLNPKAVCLNQAGPHIVGESSVDLQAAFGVSRASTPAQAAFTPPVVTTPPPAMAPVAPAPAFLQPAPVTAPKIYTVQGAQYTHEQLIGFGWTQAQIEAI